VAAAPIQPYVGFLEAGERRILEEAGSGKGVLGLTSAGLRHMGSGGVLEFGNVHLTVGGVVSDAAIGAHELFVSPATADSLGITEERYLLIAPQPGVAFPALASSIRRVAGAEPVRVKHWGETPFLREADAVLPPVLLKARFGEFASRPMGGFLAPDPSFERGHIVTESVPILGDVRCNRLVIPAIRAALQRIVDEGLSRLVDPAHYAGCYSPRFAVRDPTASISHHSWGVAIDINASTNAFGATPTQDPRLVAAFEKEGFIWGGDFIIPDGMHFEADWRWVPQLLGNG
jgi:hypothetical protein